MTMRDGGSARVEVSRVLPELEMAMAMVEEALRRGKAEDDGAIIRCQPSRREKGIRDNYLAA